MIIKDLTPTSITLHRDAPAQPLPGEPCNGCGVCCAVRLCPTGMLLFRQHRTPCHALRWNAAQRRYQCGLIIAPRDHLPWLPHWLERPATKLLYRHIAAGKGCDCTIEIETHDPIHGDTSKI
jgi:Fe-S-cluster-containing hydrogenase component 2